VLSLADALPVYHHNERHTIRVSATPERALAAAREARLEDAPFVGLLFRLRGLRAAPRGPLWDALLAQGFQKLGDDTLVLVGKPWSPRGSLVSSTTSSPSPSQLREDGDGSASRARRDGGASKPRLASTTDASARRRFGAYWLVVRPFSGLVRRWLRAARRRAEAG
jgi:hypothetical protein